MSSLTKSRRPGSACFSAAFSISSEESTPITRDSGQWSASAAVRSPVPHPRSTIDLYDRSGMRESRSKNGRVRSPRNFSYWSASHMASDPCVVHDELARDVNLTDRGPVAAVDDARHQVVGRL